MADQQEKVRRGHDELAALLARYELGTLSDQERIAFEAHLLECDECFAELERSADVAAAMRDHAPALLRVLAEREAEEGARKKHSPVSLASRIERFGERFRSLFLPLARPQVAVPVLVGLLVIAVGVRQFTRPPGFARLATFPQEEVATSAVRDAPDDDPVTELMDAGAGYFNLGHHARAERFFRAVLERDPDHAEAAYLLGLSIVLAGDADRGIPHLEKAAELAKGEQQHKASWVLANAHLKAGHIAVAGRTLDGLASAGGKYAEQARELLRALDVGEDSD